VQRLRTTEFQRQTAAWAEAVSHHHAKNVRRSDGIGLAARSSTRCELAAAGFVGWSCCSRATIRSARGWFASVEISIYGGATRSTFRILSVPMPATALSFARLSSNMCPARIVRVGPSSAAGRCRVSGADHETERRHDILTRLRPRLSVFWRAVRSGRDDRGLGGFGWEPPTANQFDVGLVFGHDLIDGRWARRGSHPREQRDDTLGRQLDRTLALSASRDQ
jgi:hypothetical protein